MRACSQSRGTAITIARDRPCTRVTIGRLRHETRNRRETGDRGWSTMKRGAPSPDRELDPRPWCRSRSGFIAISLQRKSRADVDALALTRSGDLTPAIRYKNISHDTECLIQFVFAKEKLTASQSWKSICLKSFKIRIATGHFVCIRSEFIILLYH